MFQQIAASYSHLVGAPEEYRPNGRPERSFHLRADAAHFEERGMTAQLRRFYEIMAVCGWTPARSDSA
jgi:hypothetical protein